MGFKIQMRRGAESALPQLDNAELGFAEDTRRMYVGTDVGNERIANYRDITEYMNMAYGDMQSIIRDVAYLKLMAEADDRIDSGTTFGTDFAKSINLEMHDAFFATKEPAAIGRDYINGTMAQISQFKEGEYVSVYDDVNLEQVKVVEIDPGGMIYITPLTKAYPNGVQVARSMTGVTGQFDKRRFEVAVVNTPQEDVATGNIIGTGNVAARNIAVTNSGIIAFASLVDSTIRIHALDLKKAAPAWEIVHYIQAPAGVTFNKPSLTHAFDDKDSIVVMWRVPTNQNFRVLKLPVDRYYSANPYFSATIITPKSPMLSCYDYSITTSDGGSGRSKVERYPFVITMRTEALPNSNNAYKGVINSSTNGAFSVSDIQQLTTFNTTTDGAVNSSIVDCEYGKSFGKGVSQVFYERSGHNEIYHAHDTSLGISRKKVSGEHQATRTRPTSIYVPAVDKTNPNDYGAIHVVWSEVPVTYPRGADIWHTVSYDKGETFSVPTNLTNVNKSIESAAFPNITADANGKVFVTYTMKTTDQSDVVRYHIRYKQLDTGTVTNMVSDTNGDPRTQTAYNPNIEITRPVTSYWMNSADRVRVKGAFTHEITKKHRINHLRFKLTKAGLELAMWVAKEGTFNMSAIVNGVAVTGFDDGNEVEFTRAQAASGLFDVTLVLDRPSINDNETRRVTSISGGVS